MIFLGGEDDERDDVLPALGSVQFLTELEASLSNVLDNYHRLAREAAEGREWRRKYMELLNGNIEHNRHMTAGLLGVALRVAEQEAEIKELKGPQR